MDKLSKAQRLQLFYAALNDAPAVASGELAFDLLCDTLNSVEDQHSGVIANPDNWQEDGRLYPPQADSVRTLPGHPGMKRFRSRAHNTYIAANGAIEILGIPDQKVIFAKTGADGRNVWDEL